MDCLSPIGEVFGFAFSSPEGLSIIRAVPAFILVFFLPGFAWSFVFFRQLSVIERVALSFGLSIAVVTLSLFALNMLIGIKITAVNSILVIIVITIVPVAIYYLIRLARRGSGSAT